MKNWNCRLVELNGEPDLLPWQSVSAHNPQRAAVAYCNTADAWDAAKWDNGFGAIVEVEEFGGVSGVHRMDIAAYHQLEFSATPVDESEIADSN